MTAQEKQAGINRGLKRWFFGWIAGGLGTVGMVILQDNPYPFGLIAVALLLLGGMSWWIGLGMFLYYLCCPVEQPILVQMPQASVAPPIPQRSVVPPPLPDLPTQLIQLDDLRKRGIITDAEFEAQKQKLLSS